MRVRFVPEGVEVEVAAGTRLVEAAAAAGLELNSACGGQGTCGRCAVAVRGGGFEASVARFPARLRRLGYVPACQTTVSGDVVVEVPPFARAGRDRVLLEGQEDGAPSVLREHDAGLGQYAFAPLGFRSLLRLDPPTVEGNADDWARLVTALRVAPGGGAAAADHQRAGAAGVGASGVRFEATLGVLAGLGPVLRGSGWNVAVYATESPAGWRVVRVLPAGGAPPPLGLAVDVGTTTVVVHLVDLDAGAVLAMAGAHNRQARFGDDVITRIVHSQEAPSGGQELRQAVLETINDLIGEVLGSAARRPEDLICAVVAGNTTMQHLLLGLPADQIRLEPYVPVACRYPPLAAAQLGLAMHPDALVSMVPAVASYVGGDVVAGLLVSGLADRDGLALYVDIGTNGEMVLGNREWLVACACSAGPCFEGAGIGSGLRAVDGAISSLSVDPATLEVTVRTIGGRPPLGVCGSGLIDCLAQLRLAGVIDRAGTFQAGADGPRLRRTDEGPEFVLLPAAMTGHGRDIAISEADVKNLIRAKGAVFAGLRSLLRAVQSDLSKVELIDVAGGFGNFLNIEDAVAIGMLPDVERDRYRFLGNASVKGARLALLSRQARERAERLAGAITVLELSVGREFMEEFVSALFLPHTDLSLFPSVASTLTVRGGP